MLSYKLIKRKYKLNDTNIADFFGYKSRLAFFTSTGKALLIRHMERTYDQYSAGGVKGAVDYVNRLALPGSKDRKDRYKAGLLEFIDTINFQNRKGKFVDPEAGPRADMPKYTGVKKYTPRD